MAVLLEEGDESSDCVSDNLGVGPVAKADFELGERVRKGREKREEKKMGREKRIKEKKTSFSSSEL